MGSFSLDLMRSLFSNLSIRRPVKIELGEVNGLGSYYVSSEDYNGDSKVGSKFHGTPFKLFTVRDTVKHRSLMCFCEEQRGPSYCPEGSSPVLEMPWWEKKGGGR